VKKLKTPTDGRVSIFHTLVAWAKKRNSGSFCLRKFLGSFEKLKRPVADVLLKASFG
jgi:hypothetical protein